MFVSFKINEQSHLKSMIGQVEMTPEKEEENKKLGMKGKESERRKLLKKTYI